MKKSAINFLETFATGLFLSFLIMLFVGQSLQILGKSMEPTLLDKERIIVEKVTYKGRDPKRGEVVVFRSFENDKVFLIKRVIAVPGDTFTIVDGDVYINNLKLPEPYLLPETYTKSVGVLTSFTSSPVPENTYILLGDNRDESYDSRQLGPVPKDKLVGKAFIVYWPIGNIKVIQ